jgi:hypothetical protein
MLGYLRRFLTFAVFAMVYWFFVVPTEVFDGVNELSKQAQSSLLVAAYIRVLVKKLVCSRLKSQIVPEIYKSSPLARERQNSGST